MKHHIGYQLGLIAILTLWVTACNGTPGTAPASTAVSAATSTTAPLSAATSTPGSAVAATATTGPASALTPIAEFGMAQRTLVPTGRNDYFILVPKYQIVLEDKDEKVVITVLDETKKVDGVITRVIEEKSSTQKGELVEVARNYFAIDDKTKDVFYFGEDVDNYKDGKIINHDGSWLAGEKGAKPGLIMPGQPKLGMKYFQEVAVGIAMDFASIVGFDVTVKTPAGTFAKCLKTEEGTALNPNEKEIKIYAPGIGLVQSGDLLLTKYGTVP